jgi:hypothetical protein
VVRRYSRVRLSDGLQSKMAIIDHNNNNIDHNNNIRRLRFPTTIHHKPP